MSKIPVAETIRSAYAFTLGEIGTVIGLVWIPAVSNAVAAFLVERFFGGNQDPAANGAGFAFYSLYTVFAAFVVAMIAVAIVRQALGLRQGPAIAHVSIGPAELRVFAGFAGCYLLLFIFLMGLSLVVAVLTGIGMALAPAKQMGEAVGGMLGGVVALVGLGAIFYATVRVSFLLVPAAMLEGGFGLTRSWQLTAGNFWRIVAVGLATVFPVMALVFAINLVILGPHYLAAIAAMMRDPTNFARYAAQQADLMAAQLPALLGVSLVLAPVTNGMLFAPAAFAYRALAGRTILPE